MRHFSIALLFPTLFFLACTDAKDAGTDDVTADDSGGGTTGGPIDADGDGSDADLDCDDNDANNYPGNVEECDGQDNNCENGADEGVTGTYYADSDGDGYGAGAGVDGCEGAGMVENDEDCDDSEAAINPDATELCDEIDNDCNDLVDDGTADSIWYYDADGDGYGDPDNMIESCNPEDGYVENALDCDDTDVMEPVHVAEGGFIDTGSWDTADTGAYGSADAPYGSIQDGILAANVCVVVAAGEYAEDINFYGKDVSVTGIDGAADTWIYGTGTAPVVTIASGESSGAVLSGFTITGGGGFWTSDETVTDCGSSDEACTDTWISYRGGGIYINSASPTLSDLIVTGNALPGYSLSESGSDRTYITSMGGGIYFENANPPEIINVQLTENYADIGGGAYVNGDAQTVWKWAWVASNNASSGGGIASGGRTTLSNSVIAGNGADGLNGNPGGGGVDVSSSTGYLSFENVALYANTGIASVYATDYSTVSFSNSIVFMNDDGSCLDGESSSSLSITYTDVYGCANGTYGNWIDMTGSSGNIADDPLFVDAANGDFHLVPRSPAVDAGDPASSYNDADGTANDMGAYGGPEGGW